MALSIERALTGQAILWGAPTYKQIGIAWDEFKQALGGEASFKISEGIVRLPGVGRVIFRSMDDPDNARGYTADGVVLDEVGDIKAAAWYEVLRPMLIDTGGWLMAGGTPRGRNWFWREHTIAKDRTDSMAWQTPSLGVRVESGKLYREPHPLENPSIPYAEIEQVFETTPLDTFKQEILAEFLENQGAVIRNIAACCTLESSSPGKHKGHRIVFGNDWGRQNDFTAVSVFCATCAEEVQIDRFNQIDYNIQRGRLTALADRWKASGLSEFNSMGDPIVTQLQSEGMDITPFVTSASSKAPLIEGLALAFEREEAKWIKDPIWSGELEAYERKISSAGKPTYSAPEGMHDDTVIARALAWKAAQMGEFEFRWA